MSAHGICHFIFSSTAAVYGSPNHSIPVKESDIKAPISPYGQSKYEAEQEVNKFLTMHQNKGTSLRFFNAVGRSAPELSDNSIENLLPIVMNKLKSGQNPEIFGDDYPTPDGTCIRDFIHVCDLAHAHIKAIKKLNSTKNNYLIYNIGTGIGTSVKELIETFSIFYPINYTIGNKRDGDIEFSCCCCNKMNKELHFYPKYNIYDACNHGYNYILNISK